jgi:hypothetical protein
LLLLTQLVARPVGKLSDHAVGRSDYLLIRLITVSTRLIAGSFFAWRKVMGGFLFVGASLLAKGVLPEASAPVLKNTLSLTLSLKGEGTVRSALVFRR